MTCKELIDSTQNLGQYKIEIERLSFELKNVTEQKVWAERQVLKLEKQLKLRAAANSEKENMAIEERKKIRDLEKKLKSDSLTSQNQLKKLTAALRGKDSKINELNLALQNSPKRKIPITTEPTVKPMMTKFFDEGILSFDASGAQKLQKNSEAYILNSYQQEMEQLKAKISSVYQKLSRVVVVGKSSIPPVADLATQVESLVDQLYTQLGGSISIEEYTRQQEIINSLQKKLQITDTQWKECRQRLEDLLSAERQSTPECTQDHSQDCTE